MRWLDGRNDFGWISILLHWIGAAAVVSLLFIGDSIHTPEAADADHALRLHTTLGLGMYFLLWLRVIWRLAHKHPGPLPRQKQLFYAIAKPFHYVLVFAIAAMLVTGPAMAWAGGLPVRFWNMEIPSPLGTDVQLFELLHRGHVAAASVLGWGTLLHVLAVIIHAAIHRDGSLDKMLAPAARETACAPTAETAVSSANGRPA